MKFSKASLKKPIRNVGVGALGGAGAVLGARFLGQEFGPGAGTAVAGIVTRDPWLQEMAGYQMGVALANRAPVIGGSLGTYGVV